MNDEPKIAGSESQHVKSKRRSASSVSLNRQCLATGILAVDGVENVSGDSGAKKQTIHIRGTCDR
jgi:hypothetical protein